MKRIGMQEIAVKAVLRLCRNFREETGWVIWVTPFIPRTARPFNFAGNRVSSPIQTCAEPVKLRTTLAATFHGILTAHRSKSNKRSPRP